MKNIFIVLVLCAFVIIGFFTVDLLSFEFKFGCLVAWLIFLPIYLTVEKSAESNEKLLKDILIELRKNKSNVPNIPSDYNINDLSLEQAKEILEKINKHF